MVFPDKNKEFGVTRAVFLRVMYTCPSDTHLSRFWGNWLLHIPLWCIVFFLKLYLLEKLTCFLKLYLLLMLKRWIPSPFPKLLLPCLTNERPPSYFLLILTMMDLSSLRKNLKSLGWQDRGNLNYCYSCWSEWLMNNKVTSQVISTPTSLLSTHLK